MSYAVQSADKPRRNRLRFSIRAMMLVVLAVAVVLGWRVNIARKQRAAVAAIQRSGGWVHYNWEFKNDKLTPGQSPWAPLWLRRMLGDEHFQSVRQVSLVYDDSTGKRFDNGNVDACDDLLKQIAGLPGLRSLLLKETQATDDGMRQIGRMTSLEQLYIWDARSLTDGGVAHLKSLKNLKKIHISGSNLTDESLALLSGLPSMEEMSLQHNHFSDEGLARLKGQDRLTHLYIGLGGLRVTDAGLAHLKDFEKLEILDIQQSEVSGQGLNNLKGLRNLKELWLSQVATVSEADTDAIKEAIPNLMIRR